MLTIAVTGAAVGTITALLLPSRYRAKAAFQADNRPNDMPLGGGVRAGLLGSPLAPRALGAATQNRLQLLADLLLTDAVLRHVRGESTHPGALLIAGVPRWTCPRVAAA